MPAPWEKYQDQGPWSKYQDNGGILDNAVSDIGDLASGAVQAAKGIAMSPVTIPMSIYQTGQQLSQGQPMGQTPIGQQAQQLAQMPGQIYDRAKQIVTHPIDSFQQHPIKTALDVASVAAPIAGALLPEASLADMAASAGKTGMVGQAAQDATLNAIGASKRFLNNPMKEAKMQQTAQTLLNEGLVSSNARKMAADTQKLAETSGKAIGDHLEAMGASGNFILPQEFKAAIEDLRPSQPSTGKILTQGHNQFINDAIDKALATVDDYGDKPISFQDANQLKGTLQDAANWQSNKNATVIDRMIAGRARETVDNALDRTSQQMGNPAAHQEFLQNKQRYSAAMNAQDPLYNKISSEVGNDKMSLTDYILAAGAITEGNIGEAAALLGGKSLMRHVGPALTANKLNSLNNMNLKGLGIAAPVANVGTMGLSNGSQQ